MSNQCRTQFADIKWDFYKKRKKKIILKDIEFELKVHNCNKHVLMETKYYETFENILHKQQSILVRKFHNYGKREKKNSVEISDN